MLKHFKIALLLSSLLSLSAIAHADVIATDPQDPYENYNRHAFKMNDTLDKAIFKPVATGYNKVLPWPLRKGIDNFLYNLNMIPAVGNDILQGEGRSTVSDTWRFVINSTVGIGGLFDVASHVGFPYHENDLGVTFAKWGYKDSAYFVLPIYGPSTIRDTVAIIPNYELMTVYPYIPWKTRYALIVLYAVNYRANLLNYQHVIDIATLDPYVFQRDAYLQHREYLLTGDSGSKDSYSNDDDVSKNPH